MARLTKGAVAKANPAQLARQVGVKVPKSQVKYPKPVDLVLGKIKSSERGMEVRYRC